MTDEGRKIGTMLTQVINIYEDVALLLNDADRFMGEAGWESYGNSCMYDSSSSLQSPRKWAPNEVLRFYKKTDSSNLLASIVVQLIYRDDPEIYKLEEPLICGLWFDFDEESGDNWKHWYCRFHLYNKNNRKDDGTIIPLDVGVEMPTFQKRHNIPFKKVYTLGLPLVQIKSSDDIKTKVINPLIQSIDKYVE